MLLTCFNELSAFYRIHSSWCMIYLRLIEMPAAFQRWVAIYRHRNTVRMIRKLCVFSTTKYSGGNHGTEWMKHHNTQLTCWWRVSINLNSMSPRHTFTNYYMVQMTHVMLISTIYHVYQYMKVDKVSCVLWHNLPYGIHQRALSRITQNKQRTSGRNVCQFIVITTYSSSNKWLLLNENTSSPVIINTNNQEPHESEMLVFIRAHFPSEIGPKCLECIPGAMMKHLAQCT